MRAPLYIRELTTEEQPAVEAGLRSKDLCRLRRCQIVAASASKEWVPAIARTLGCDEQTVRHALHEFDAKGIMALERQSTRPKHIHAALPPERYEPLKALLHRSPWDFGKNTSLWTRELVAEVCFEEKLMSTRVSRETIRATLQRMKVNWKRAKKWITSPDPEYVREKTPGTG